MSVLGHLPYNIYVANPGPNIPVEGPKYNRDRIKQCWYIAQIVSRWLKTLGRPCAGEVESRLEWSR